MATIAAELEVPADLQSDTDVIVASVAAGKPVPADVAERARRRAAAITEEVRRKHGTVDIGVPAIRELRDA